MLIEGQELGALTEKELRGQRSDIAMIFQNFNLLMQKSVLDNVCFPMQIQEKKKKEARERARELLKTVGLSEKEKAYPAQLSGGQRQRLTIARALVGNPEILILDDSSSALDFATDAALRRAIRRETGKMTVFLVSQRASSVRQADKILVLDDGELAGVGTHQQLFESCQVYREICLSQLSEKEVEGR